MYFICIQREDDFNENEKGKMKRKKQTNRNSKKFMHIEHRKQYFISV